MKVIICGQCHQHYKKINNSLPCPFCMPVIRQEPSAKRLPTRKFIKINGETK